jgi:hypothetical protein
VDARAADFRASTSVLGRPRAPSPPRVSLTPFNSKDSESQPASRPIGIARGSFRRCWLVDCAMFLRIVKTDSHRFAAKGTYALSTSAFEDEGLVLRQPTELREIVASCFSIRGATRPPKGRYARHDQSWDQPHR